MSGISELKKYKDEILKAEVGALLFNLGKTHIGFWHEKDGVNYWELHFGITDEAKFKNDFKNKFGYSPFGNYKNYHAGHSDISKTPFEYETEKCKIKDFIFNQKVTFPFLGNNSQLDWVEFFKGDSSDKDFIKKIFFRGCENINSGIDKGAPKKQLTSGLWLANAFGSYKRKVEIQDLDDERVNFYNKLHCFLLINNYFVTPNWNKIREFVVKEIKNWYSRLLSDSRFPVNDVTLWDQAFMTATMFKATLANMVINSSKYNEYFNNPSSIKWRILGIQYDKLGLAEKGYKPQQIQWYRETSHDIDEEVKKLIEYEYPIGNEIYRDETGIYFLVGEDIGEDLKDESNLAKLKDDLKEIKEKTLEIFKGKSQDEFYPAIFLTKASRGLMNLTFLLEKAKENFLKADWNKKDTNLCLEKSNIGKAIGICQVCKQRLVYENKEDKRPLEDKIICDFCYEEKTRGRINKWFQNRNGETIWTSELKDDNGRIALVTLKFELRDWLNGNMLNSMLIREENYSKVKQKVRELLSSINRYYVNFLNQANKNLQEFKNFRSTGQIDDFLNLFEKNAFKKPYNDVIRRIINILDKLNKGAQLKDEEEESTLDLFNRYFFSFLEEEWDNIKEQAKSNNSKAVLNKNQEEIFAVEQQTINIDKWKNHYQQGGTNLLLDIFSFSYVRGLIQNTLLERSIGDRWEEFIYKQLSDWDDQNKKPLNQKIDFNNRKIFWNNLTDPDIDFLSELILQFLLRKNPSPARLRRVWESTKEFFEEIEKSLIFETNILKIPLWRRQRVVFSFNTNDSLKEGIYETNGVLFYKPRELNQLYLISSVKDYLEKFKPQKLEEIRKQEKNKEKIEFSLKENDVSLNNIELKFTEDEKEKNKVYKCAITKTKLETYLPYMSILDPTPVSWQFIIPAQCVPNLIDNIINKYNECFRFVYGKLPLHIGVVIQDYKKPLYVGINALRRIRRDVKDLDKLYIEKEASEIKKTLQCQKTEEHLNNTQAYYSLYWNKNITNGYKFYIKPDAKHQKCIVPINNINNTDMIQVIPNTFDFEFLDTNLRRNEIYYQEDKDYKRLYSYKQSRPIDLEKHWEKFKKFKALFSDKASSSKLHKLINILYEKAETQDIDEVTAQFLASSFINILELNKNKQSTELLKEIFDIDQPDLHSALSKKFKNKENIYLFLSMFEFWHKALKEV